MVQRLHLTGVCIKPNVPGGPHFPLRPKTYLVLGGSRGSLVAHSGQ